MYPNMQMEEMQNNERKNENENSHFERYPPWNTAKEKKQKKKSETRMQNELFAKYITDLLKIYSNKNNGNGKFFHIQETLSI